MWLNCKRPDLNDITGKLVLHYAGVIEDHPNLACHIWIGTDPVCGVCHLPIPLGDAASVVGELIAHATCVQCGCPVHLIFARPTIPDPRGAPQVADSVQLSLL
ncbi:MAG: hypothetical protein HY868_16705 [Chloroflexi bacterium]|nr:hypothetical protein [Chloroflexota bacterium]